MPQANTPKSPLRSLICLPTSLSISPRSRERERQRQRSKTGFSSTSSGDSGTSGTSGASSASRTSDVAMSPAVSAPPPMPTVARSEGAGGMRDGRGSGEQEREGGDTQDTDGLRKRRIQKIMDGNPQIIPLYLTDEWDLVDVLERNFEPNEFKAEVCSISIAPGNARSCSSCN